MKGQGALMAKKKKKKLQDPDVKMVCRNRRARHDYEIADEFEAGLVLVGSEVKSIRAGQADLSDGYGCFKEGELFLIGVHVAPYDKANRFGHEPRRQRKLLVHGHALKRLQVKIRERGYTLIPLELYFRKGWAKVLMGLAKGRKQYDNRDLIRKKTERRELRQNAE
jgi:SsrA-binding protein